MMRSTGIQSVCAIFLSCLAMTAGVTAQTFTKLLDFNGSNGADPYYGSLVQGTDGNSYGVTFQGGVSANCQALGVNQGCGTIFKMTPGGTLTTIYDFCQQSGCTDGYIPTGITLSSNGNFYGTTYAGGTYGQGTVFRVTPRGILTSLYSFCVQANCADGRIPLGGIIQASDGNWYGTTFGGGNPGCGYGCGTVFRVTPAGQLTTLYTFPSSGNPAAPLIQGRDGNLYGTATGNSGNSGSSTIFRITLSGTFTTVYQFDQPADIYYGLVQGSDGNFYGTTAIGGSNSASNCSLGCGTVFKLTPGGTLNTLYNFCSQANCTDGATPGAPLIQSSNGKFYGTTSFGGSLQAGTIFSISSTGALTTLHSFDVTDGAVPYGGLVQNTNGVIYGMTSSGGSTDDGVAFSLNGGLHPFASFVRNTGKVGSTVQILGQGFTGTTAVSFNGTPATYSIKSDTFLTATVPSGATTGLVIVTVPGGTLTSNRPFRVSP
ncbi:MAG: choice-of-anchor tandem repeat GloVer-containing protein [Candidatus Sulfotelmatobacter sp.]